jgi:hypothetical protein
MSVIFINPFRFAAAYHPEAESWQTRVIANGGSVSTATMQAVSDFCVAIDAASGLRAALVRLNLFCGDNLNAALVPLYLAASSGGATVGNATDTNNNFVSGDYVLTGASGGLTGNGSTKYLDTGVAQNAVSGTSCHLSVSGTGFSTTIEAVSIGAYNNAQANLHDLNHRVDIVAGTIVCIHRCGSFGTGNARSTTLQSNESHLLGTRTSSTASALYRAGSSVDTQTSSVTPSFVNTRSYYVFGINNIGSVAALTDARLRMYSIGAGLNATQVSAFSAAVAAFNSALSR